MKTALIIIDMLNDFVRGGVLANEAADAIIPPIQSLLKHAREQADWVVVFANDAHLEGDVEIDVWGKHAMKGTRGAQVIEALAPQPGPQEWEEPKRFYGVFEDTNLAEKLRAQDVDTVCLTGQHTNCCVRHSAYGSFRHGLNILVPEDAVVAFNEDNKVALAYLQTIYGAKITTTEDVLALSTAV